MKPMGVAKKGSTSEEQCGGAEVFWFLPCWLSCNDLTLLWINSYALGSIFEAMQTQVSKPTHQLITIPMPSLTGAFCPPARWTPHMAEVGHWWHPLHLHRLCGNLTTLRVKRVCAFCLEWTRWTCSMVCFTHLGSGRVFSMIVESHSLLMRALLCNELLFGTRGFVWEMKM